MPKPTLSPPHARLSTCGHLVNWLWLLIKSNYQHSYSFVNRPCHNSGYLDILGQRTSLAAISDGICEAGD